MTRTSAGFPDGSVAWKRYNGWNLRKTTKYDIYGTFENMKVIHVHLIFKKKNYYFGSLSAIFEHLSENDIGIKKGTLLHRSKEGTISTDRAIIIKGVLLKCRKHVKQ